MLKTISRRFASLLVHKPAADDKAQRVDHFRATLRARDCWLGLQMKKVFALFIELYLLMYAVPART
jgi:hypothetical protein